MMTPQEIKHYEEALITIHNARNAPQVEQDAFWIWLIVMCLLGLSVLLALLLWDPRAADAVWAYFGGQ